MASRGGTAAFFRSKSDESSDNLPTSLPLSLSLCCGGFGALGKCFHLSPPLRRSSLPFPVVRRTDGRTDADGGGRGWHEC